MSEKMYIVFAPERGVPIKAWTRPGRVYSRATAAGAGSGRVPPGITNKPWGERSFYVVDPFGNPLCFVDARTLFRG